MSSLARTLVLAVLFGAVAVGLVMGQARDFKPPTPDESLKRMAGDKPDVDDPQKKQYQPRRMAVPGDANSPWRGRSPFKVMNDGNEPVKLDSPFSGDAAYEMTLELDQYLLDFEFETPRMIQVTGPDGSVKIYWYMMFRTINWEEFPIYGRLNFAAKTMAQDIFPTPEGLTPEQEAEINNALLKQFAGDTSSGGSMDETPLNEGRKMSDMKAELLRGIKRALAFDYLSFPDRQVIDAIANKEGKFHTDRNGMAYNSLVPVHLFQWRNRLMPNDAGGYGYEYPEVAIQEINPSAKTQPPGNAYIVKPRWKGPATEPGFTVWQVSATGGGKPTKQDYDNLESFKNGWGRNEVNVLADSPFTLQDSRGDREVKNYNTLPLWQVFLRRWPMYHKGTRVDQYGFVMKPGHPDYDNGVLLQSDFTIWKALYGSQLAPINTADGPFQGYTVLSDKEVTVPAEPEKLPVCDGKKLVTPQVETMFVLVSSLDFSRDAIEKENAALWGSIRNNVDSLKGMLDSSQMGNLAEVRRQFEELLPKLLEAYESKQVPTAVAVDLESQLVRPSRLYFLEAAGQNAHVIGRAGGGDILWNARFQPAVCYQKYPTPRRYKAGEQVLRNYKTPLAPAWEMPQNAEFGANLNKPIGAKNNEYNDPRHFVNGMVLDAYEYQDEDGNQPLSRDDVNRFGQTGRAASYQNSSVKVESQQPFFDDDRWGRDEGKGDGKVGRPIKRRDHFGRPLYEGFREYRPGDRVTPMEWDAYASLLPTSILREYKTRNAYDPQRQYLQPGDLLVGQPRLTLAEFKYKPVDKLGRTRLEPLADMMEHSFKDADGNEVKQNRIPAPQQVWVDETGRYWRNGFSCDAAGDYDALVFEELSENGQREFDRLVEHTVNESRGSLNAQAASERTFIKLVPVFDQHGAAKDWVNPVTKEKVPLRTKILTGSEDEPEVVAKDTGGNTVFCKAYAKLPDYLYEYDYEAISDEDARANSAIQDPCKFELQRLVDDAKTEQEKKRKQEGGDALPQSGLDDSEGRRRIDGQYWGDEKNPQMGEVPDPSVGKPMVNLFKVDARPTLGPARINFRCQPKDKILIPRDRRVIHELVRKDTTDDKNPVHKNFDQIVVRNNKDVFRVVSEEDDNGKKRYVTKIEPDWYERYVVYYGTIVDDSRADEIVFEVEKEIIPAVAEGVAVFGELDPNWDFMNVYVTGIKGPIRRDGLNAVGYQTIPNRVDDDKNPAPAQRFEYSPRYVQENWTLMLRFERTGDEFNRQKDPIHYVRKYWYLPKTAQELKLRGGE